MSWHCNSTREHIVYYLTDWYMQQNKLNQLYGMSSGMWLSQKLIGQHVITVTHALVVQIGILACSHFYIWAQFCWLISSKRCKAGLRRQARVLQLFNTGRDTYATSQFGPAVLGVRFQCNYCYMLASQRKQQAANSTVKLFRNEVFFSKVANSTFNWL